MKMQEMLRKDQLQGDSQRDLVKDLLEDQEQVAFEDQGFPPSFTMLRKGSGSPLCVIVGDEEDSDLGRRFEGVDLDQEGFEEIWSRLTVEERLRFQQEVRSGQLLDGVEEWKPWWTILLKGPVVDLERERLLLELLPAVETNIPRFSLKVDPPKELMFNLVEML